MEVSGASMVRKGQELHYQKMLMQGKESSAFRNQIELVSLPCPLLRGNG